MQYYRTKIVFLTNSAGTMGHPQAKRKKKKDNLETSIAFFTKIYSKWIIDQQINAKYKTVGR